MTNTDSKKRRKRVTAAVAMVLILALLGGTFAWNNYRQHKTNDANIGGLHYKAVLVEEYDNAKARDWKTDDPELTKKISVLNPGNGEADGDNKEYGDIFARIQLKEFMEFYPMNEEFTPDRYMIDTDGQFIKFYPGRNYQITADEETGWPVAVETDAPVGGTIFAGGEDAAREYARILGKKADNGLHQVRRQRVYFTPLRTASVAANRDSIDAWLRHYNAFNNTNLLLSDITVDGAGVTLSADSKYLPAGMIDAVNGLDDDELPWYIQTKEDDPNGVYGNFILLDAQVDNANPRNMLIDEDEDGVADFLGTPIPERADEDQKKSPDGLHDELIDSAVDVGYTIPQLNGECEYTPHRWVDGMNQWDVNGPGNPSYFDYIEWVFGENVILLSNWDGNPVKKWIIDDRDTGNSNGWVWWGYYLAPGEQTGNLLESLVLVAPSDDKTYYALHADMQAVSYEELTRWEEENDMSGNDRIVDALRRSVLKVSNVMINEKPTEIMRGTTFNFSAKVQGTVGVNKAVTWSLLGYNGTHSSIDQNGVLTIGAAETAATLTVRATSVYDNTKYAVWTFNVKPDNSVDGATHIIPGSKLNDDSDWMAIAETDGYYLIVRLNNLPVGTMKYMASGNHNYAASNVKNAIELWYDNINTGTNSGTSTGTLEGLKSFAVRSDADTVLGSFGNITAPVSKPSATTGYAYPFALSFQEASKYASVLWYDTNGVRTANGIGQYAASNWQYLYDIGDGGTVKGWLRSPGKTAANASMHGWLGNINEDPVSTKYAVRPAMWVRAEVFD